MATNKQIKDFPTVESASNGDFLHISRGGVDNKITVENLIPALGGFGSVIINTFTDGAEYTAGVDNVVGLTQILVSKNNAWVFFDGVYQNKSTYNVSNNLLTFNEIIPEGVSTIEVVMPIILPIGTTTSADQVEFATGVTVEDQLSINLVFNNVAAMQAATWLQIGWKCRTLGYYSIGDGGSNDYEIVAAATGTDDGGSFIDLNTYQARGLFPGGIRFAEQYGATNNLYVSTTGDDLNTGFDSLNPKATIQSAIDFYAMFARSANSDWIINVEDGTYPAGGVIDGIRSNYQIIIQGETKTGTIIDGANLITHGFNFNSGVRGRIDTLTIKNFTSSLIAFQNGSFGTINDCNGDGITNFGFNASEFSDMNISGTCQVNVGVGGRGIRYYRNSTGSLTGALTLDGGGTVSDGTDIRNGSEVICTANFIANNFQNFGVLVRNGGMLELRTSTISNNAIGIRVDDLSRFAEVGPVTYTGNTQDRIFEGGGLLEGQSLHRFIGKNDVSGAIATSTYDVIVDNNGETGIQMLSNGNTVRLDFDALGRVVHSSIDNTMRIFANNIEGLRLNTTVGSGQSSAFLLVNDGTTTSLRRVNVGASDSGGAGQRLLTVDN